MLCATADVAPSASWEIYARELKMAGVDRESIRQEVRARIHKELNNNSQGTLMFVNRTRNLIRGFAFFAARSLPASPFASGSVRPLPQRQNFQSSDKGKRPFPGHPCRLG